MSGIIIASATAALTAAATVVVASLPEAQAVLSPLTEGGGEFAMTAVAMIFAFPILAVLTVIAGSSQD